MSEYIAEQKKHKKQIAGNSILTTSLRDRRNDAQPARLQDKRLLGNTLQLVKTKVEKQDPKQVVLTANGNVSEFEKGKEAGKNGWNGVKSYAAGYKIGTAKWVTTSEFDNEYQMAHAGHVLAQQNGGEGDKNNIFAQDGGVNTVGPWVRFEKGMRKALKKANQTEPVEFRTVLNGENIKSGNLEKDNLKTTDLSEEDLALLTHADGGTTAVGNPSVKGVRVKKITKENFFNNRERPPVKTRLWRSPYKKLKEMRKILEARKKRKKKEHPLYGGGMSLE